MSMFEIPKRAVRGIRALIPSGYLIGRISPGEGPPELLPIAQVIQSFIKTAMVSPGPTNGGDTQGVATAGWNLVGPFTTSQVFEGGTSVNAINYPNIQANSYAKCRQAPTANTTIYVVYDLAAFNASGPAAANSLASIAFAAGGTSGTISWYTAGQKRIAADTTLYIVTAVDIDATFADVTVLMAGDVTI